jgi:hypothetical protein
MEACFPENTWFGVGIGGLLMTNSELVFFMAPTGLSLRKVISTRVNGTKSTRPQHFPDDSPIYERNISTCGEGGKILFQTRRPLNASHLEGGEGIEPLGIGVPFDFTVAGLYNEFNSTYAQMPSHTRGKGYHT